MKDNTSRKAGDFHASRKGSKDLRASLDDQKTNTKNHGHEFGTNKSRRDLCWVKGTEGGERREDTEGQMRETSWVSRTTVRDEMGFRREMRWVPRAEMGYRREMRWVPREARDDTEGQRRRGTEEARDDGRSQARGEGNDESEVSV
ncbi:hypothetical protein OIU76_026582 [Salix suchowensis]|nr:hypothetical protein OIU78_023714 [Salix suchowensis]KAJ6372116.1 hypothetical protein OIU76_026582 [Salix suchowensis]